MMMGEMIFGLSLTGYYEQLKNGNTEEADRIKEQAFKRD